MSIVATTELNTEFGSFNVNYHSSEHGECMSFSMGDLSQEEVFIRLHSACIFGEAFSACDCDCKQQLLHAMQKISENKRGIVVYLFQEGRGVGLQNKIKAINHQHIRNIDTVEAFQELGFELDSRDYQVAVDALQDLEVSNKLILMCNNYRKFSALKKAGYEIIRQESLEYTITQEANDYLKVKCKKLNHNIDFTKLLVVG